MKDIKTLAKAIAPYGINFVSEKPNWFSSKASGRDFDAFGQSYKTFDEFVWLIAKRADFGEMIAKKFYREFVSVKPPKTNDIAILMSKFRSSNFSIPKLFEATISLKSFWSEESRLNIVKSHWNYYMEPQELLATSVENRITIDGWKHSQQSLGKTCLTLQMVLVFLEAQPGFRAK